MFEPTTFAEKRANLNETMMHRFLAVQMRLGQKLQNPALRFDAAGNRQTVEQCHVEASEQLQYHFQDYSRRSQQLRDLHAAEVLGEVVEKEGETLVNVKMLLELLQNNMGRAWFLGAENISLAADGTVGSAGFGKKYKDWVDSLPDLDESMTDDIQSGFYADGLSGIGIPVAALVIRYGDEVLSVIYTGQPGASVVNLAHTKLRKNALRSEQYSYRQNIPHDFFITEFEKALRAAGVAEDYRFVAVKPAVPEEAPVVTNGFVATEEALAAAAEAAPATVTTTAGDEQPVDVATEGRGLRPEYVQVDEAPYVYTEKEDTDDGSVQIEGNDAPAAVPTEEQPQQ